VNKLAYGIREAAEALNLSPWTIRAHVKTSKLRASRVGTRILIPIEELQRLLREGQESASQTSIRGA
jgi:excisionase family DNA binding protein